jgi:hypothetical protein
MPTATGSPSKSLTPAEAGAVLLVRSGRSIEAAAKESELTVAEVTDALHRADANRAARPVPAAVATPPPVRMPTPGGQRPSAPAPSSVDELLRWAEASDVERARTLAARMRAIEVQLRGLEAQREKIRVAKAAITVLERQLAKAKADLRAATSTKAAAPSTPAPAPRVAPSKPGGRAGIRAWAAANGFEGCEQGRLRQEVVDAYDAAHPAA